MDESKEYAKMCKEAIEIQSMRFADHANYEENWESGDFYYNDGCYVFESWSLDHQGGLDYEDLHTWIPRQDQLQEIAKEVFAQVGDRITHTLIYEFTSDIRDHSDGNITEYYYQFTSFEQLWLAFVMKEKYDKRWNTKKKEWVKV